MRTIVQRVSEASVTVQGECVARIGPGALLLVGVEQGDCEADAVETARKVAALRFFAGRTPMDLTLAEVNGECLVVSQFTLLASLRRGNRPGFEAAEQPTRAAQLYERVQSAVREQGLPVQGGRFGAHMSVALVNDGPVTLLLEVRHGRVVELRDVRAAGRGLES